MDRQRAVESADDGGSGTWSRPKLRREVSGFARYSRYRGNADRKQTPGCGRVPRLHPADGPQWNAVPELPVACDVHHERARRRDRGQREQGDEIRMAELLATGQNLGPRA